MQKFAVVGYSPREDHPPRWGGNWKGRAPTKKSGSGPTEGSPRGGIHQSAVGATQLKSRGVKLSEPVPQRGPLQRFYFNASIGKCLAFIYNGCGGNDNRFDTLQQCQQLCSKGQYFYYNAEWQSCMTFIYTGCGGNANKFLTREQCEAHCQYADGSACLGPVPSIIPEDNDGDCTNTTCPEGYQCAYGFGFIECCNSTIKNAVSEAYASKCPDGSQAGGVSKDYFMATFAASCDDLMCNSDQRCVQVSQFFAKCCSDNTTILSPSETMVESGRRMHTLPCKQYSSPTTP
ncbi:unnamed protein product [Anisakis simplex]|uniref:BPTI/Kunitz inhibitor domain-containing protein n=1 Tax=Anisakis simplex TaxID=6269 RepID=A0A3P6QI18_ANISI|nr:unnamed protein product [Anisakis simplex]